MDLSMAPLHQLFNIKKIRGRGKVIKMLSNMGVQEGKDVMVISESDGNLVIRVSETRLAISKDLARKIII